MGIIDKIFKKRQKKSLGRNTSMSVSSVQQGVPVYNEARLFEVNAWIYAGIKRIADSAMLIDYSITPDKVKSLFINNPYSSFRILLRKTLGQLQVYGFTFWSIIDGQLMIVPPYSIMDATQVNNGWQLKYMATDGNTYYTNPELTIKIENFNPTSNTFGLSPISLLKQTAMLSDKVEILNNELLDYGNYTQGYFHTEKQLNDTLYKKIQNRYIEFLTGRNSVRMPLILDNGLQYEKLNIIPEQIKDLNLDEITRDKVSAVLGVPAALLNAYDKLNYATAKEQIIVFWTITVIPILKYLEEVINNQLIRKLFNKGSFKFIFDNIEELKQNELTKAQIYHIYLEDGVMTTEEVRERLGLEPLNSKSLSMYYKRFLKTINHAERKVQKSNNPKEIIPVLLAVAQQGADTATFDLNIEEDYNVSGLYEELKNKCVDKKDVKKAFNIGYYYVASKQEDVILYVIDENGNKKAFISIDELNSNDTIIALRKINKKLDENDKSFHYK